MNSSEDALMKAMRKLADACPQGAPPELYLRLADTFGEHHSRIRQKRIATLLSLAACITIAISWIQFRRTPSRSAIANISLRSVPAVVAPSRSVGDQEPATHLVVNQKPKANARKTTKTLRVQSAAAMVSYSRRDFVALPSFDPSVPVGQSRILRLEISGSALQLVGYPASEDVFQRSVLADVLVGQDGEPYAVRLIQIHTVEH